MIKKSTGVVFTPQEFKKLYQCLNCGKAEICEYGSKCDNCVFLNLKNCEICEILLRTGLNTYYTYDTFTTHRDNDVGFKASKNLVREFTFKDYPFSEKYSDTLCVGCKDWETDMKNNCIVCGDSFKNNKEYYKNNGNVCRGCTLR